jgi:hypothetical protein
MTLPDSSLVSQLQPRLEPEELFSLSRIVLLDAGNPVVEAVHRVVHVEHIPTEFVNCVFFGLLVQHAYIITSRREGSSQDPAVA